MHSTEISCEGNANLLKIKCSSCSRPIQLTDWIRRAKQNVYHLACFSCDICKRQLSTGEEFAFIEDSILCKLHYVEHLELPASCPVLLTNSSVMENSPELIVDEDQMWIKHENKNKRVRTSFTDEQVLILQANFDLDANPDSNELERIAADVSLPKRVTQVWFQNSRARQKKQQQHKTRNHYSHCGTCNYYPCSCSNSNSVSDK
ncbi:LIM/homeobox protein Awh [Hydra vulgaris]|uniref:LIM/homeobox protein Awh n=1 Tax=Hydra vulgaris TaxID=6087 RepID=A0ABM4D298_HYDVU